MSKYIVKVDESTGEISGKEASNWGGCLIWIIAIALAGFALAGNGSETRLGCQRDFFGNFYCD